MKEISNSISIDFDGVMIRLMGNREWVVRESAQSAPKSFVYKVFEFGAQFILQFFRRETVNLSNNLRSLNSQYSLNIVTSRYSYISIATKFWLWRKGILKIFDSINFNDNYEVPWEYKARRIKDLKASYHIDDNLKSVIYLSENLEDTQIIWFDIYSNQIVELPNSLNLHRFSSWDEICKFIFEQNG